MRTFDAGFLEPALDGGFEVGFSALEAGLALATLEAGLPLAFEGGFPLASAALEVGLLDAFDDGLTAVLDSGLV